MSSWGVERGRFRAYAGCTSGTFGLCAALCRNGVFWSFELRLGPLWLLVLLIHRVTHA